MRWYSEICCRAPAPLRVASLHFNLLLKPCAAVTAKHFTACLDVGNTLALSRGQCNANGSRFIILFIMPDMNHALCAVPPPKELVKSCEAALFLIHSCVSFISVSSSGCFLILRFTVISTELRRISYFTNKTKIKKRKEKEQTAEPIMRGKLDNQQTHRHANFIPE